ncbi:MAG: sulfur carrier protein ThiS [Candidatus Binataceae bacterium]
MSARATTQITLNGEAHTIDGDLGLSTLLEKLKVRGKRIAVEINGDVVRKADYARVMLRAGDKVEVINFVGGG